MSEQATYGGQAVIEGVMVRGPRSMAVAARKPDGSITTRGERLGGVYTGTVRRLPLLRGVLVLWETLALGFRALAWSAAVAADEVDDDGEATPLGVIEWLILILTLGVGVGIFFVGPVLATAWLDSIVGAAWISVVIEGGIRIVLLLGYIWAIGRAKDVRRVFQYHGAEHMTILAFEQGHELTVPSIRRFAKEHPRCGTSFLLTVAIVAIFVFAVAGTEPLWWRFASRIVFVPVVAAISYEAIRFAGFHQDWPVVRWLFAGNIALQHLTTREPEDEHIQVAMAALERVRAEEDAPAA